MRETVAVDRASAYRETAEAGWRWVLAQVTDDDGPRIPISVPEAKPEPEWRDGLHSGIGGLAHALREIHLARPWSPEESHLAEGVGRRIRGIVPTMTDTTYFDGLVSAIGTLLALEEPGAEVAVSRLLEVAGPDGWPQPYVAPPRYEAGGTINDVTLGTGAVLLGAVWALRHEVPGAGELAERAVEVLVAEAEETDDGLDWPFVPRRFWAEPDRPPMPNFSHGLAGIAAALAVTGAELDRADLVEAAQRGAAHYVGLADTSEGGCRVPRQVPLVDDDDNANGWCHGPTGASLLFPALGRAGVTDVAGRPVAEWRHRCLHSVRTSGIPERLRPGFWDNDGRCCGTAGVVDVLLDAWQDGGTDEELDFALHLCDVLVERAVREDEHASWRFVEHRNEEPLLPPGVGWMQGAAGIAAVLLRASRLLDQGREAPAVRRMDTWWALPEGLPHHRGEEPQT
jgi:Lanthionine synthetase C-like protein